MTNPICSQRHISAHEIALAAKLVREYIQTVAEIRLDQLMDLDDCRITCEYQGGVLTLRGSVPSYRLKHMARLSLRRLAEIVPIDNQLTVVSPRMSGYQGGIGLDSVPR